MAKCYYYLINLFSKKQISVSKLIYKDQLFSYVFA